MSQLPDVTPCPFCGSSNVSVEEGDNYRWRVARCCQCGAQSGDVRIQTTGEGTREEWEAIATASAMREWNKRVPAVERHASDDEEISWALRVLVAWALRVLVDNLAYSDDFGDLLLNASDVINAAEKLEGKAGERPSDEEPSDSTHTTVERMLSFLSELKAP